MWRAAQGAVIPAQAGIHFSPVNSQWIPACAGMTIMWIPALRTFVMLNKCRRGGDIAED
jgi:hypothetical protein